MVVWRVVVVSAVFIMTVLGVGPLSQLTYRQDQETPGDSTDQQF